MKWAFLCDPNMLFWCDPVLWLSFFCEKSTSSKCYALRWDSSVHHWADSRVRSVYAQSEHLYRKMSVAEAANSLVEICCQLSFRFYGSFGFSLKAGSYWADPRWQNIFSQKRQWGLDKLVTSFSSEEIFSTKASYFLFKNSIKIWKLCYESLCIGHL